MLIKSNKVLFENRADIIDYVSKGIPPKKKDFTDFTNAFGIDQKIEGKPYIPSSLLNMSQEDLRNVLERVYKNNRRNTWISAGLILGALVGGLTIGLFIGGCGKTESKPNDERAEGEVDVICF